MSSHSGWIEFTNYSESVRQTWTPSAASGQSITNPSACVFTAAGAATIQGGFIVSNNTKSGTSGVLYATGSFSAAKTLANTDQLKVTYACNSTVS